MALGLGVIALAFAQKRLRHTSQPDHLTSVALYLILVSMIWGLARLTPHALNLSLRIIAKGRRRFRPWLHHHIRLLPPRWRVRLRHERGRGPLRLKEEILRFGKKRKSQRQAGNDRSGQD
jgi:hypothetical protein